VKDSKPSSTASSLFCGTRSPVLSNSGQKTLVARTEAEIIHLAQTGDESAFEFLYKTNRQRIYALCLRLTRNPGLAEDLMQEAFLQAFRKINSFREESTFSSWLYRIGFNVALMHLRKKGLQEVALEQTCESEDNDSRTRQFGALDPVASATCDRVSLNRAIRELPNGYKKILLLHDVLGHLHCEIASLLGCSIGNSKSQLHKARLRMREILEVKSRQKQQKLSTLSVERTRTTQLDQAIFGCFEVSRH
jgi:RNA polymerase sigma-70 factor (ECF subfamily)